MADALLHGRDDGQAFRDYHARYPRAGYGAIEPGSPRPLIRGRLAPGQFQVGDDGLSRGRDCSRWSRGR